MIRHVVPPRLRDLIAAPPADANRAATAWLRPGDEGLWFSRATWGLVALVQALATRLGRRPRVLIPDYFCAEPLLPLRSGLAELSFAAVDANGCVDWAGAQTEPDLVLLVHLFGRPAPGADARAFADRCGAILLEDAAHVLGPIPGVGELGDLVLYSPHKLLGLPDGGLLVLRPRAVSLRADLTQAVAELGRARPSPARWLLRRLLQASPAWPLVARLRHAGQADFLADPHPAAPTPPVGVSRLALRLAAFTDLTQVGARRRANADALRRTLAGLGPWQEFQPDQGDVPLYRLVLRSNAPSDAIALFGRLRAAGLPVESWPDLPIETTARGATHALDLRRTLVMLPVHQALEPDALARAYGKALA
jgi:hypothetical protein